MSILILTIWLIFIKIFMVKTMGIFHKSLNQRIKQIEKNKKLSSNEKFDKIVELYRVYFYYIIHNDINMATFELHYEEFMEYNKELKKDIKKPYEYSECYRIEEENKMYYECITILKIIDKLNKNGLQIEKTKPESQKFYNDIMEVKEKCGLDDSFPYEAFYFDERIRSSVSRHTVKFYKQIVNEIDEIRKNRIDDDKEKTDK